jgi:hypothetical protein
MSSFDRRDDRDTEQVRTAADRGVGPDAGRQAERRDIPADEEFHILRGPGYSEEEALQERLAVTSPDGRPPPVEIHRETRQMFFLALTVTSVVVLVAIYAWGGIGPLAVALVMWGVFIGLAAFPTWHAALARRADEDRARRELTAQRLGRPMREPDRRVSGD